MGVRSVTMGSGLVGRGKELFCGCTPVIEQEGTVWEVEEDKLWNPVFRPLLTYIANVKSWCDLCVNA